ncbi:unnamed protein product, partial [Mesorhabditis spiculigera]
MHGHLMVVAHYDDEQGNDQGEDRWERRARKKSNKAEREQRRKEEIKRIADFVRIAHSKDPRISKLRNEEPKKKAKEERARLRPEKEGAEELEKRKPEEAVAEENEKSWARLGEAVNRSTTDSKEKLAAMERFDRLINLLETDEIRKPCDAIEKMKLDAPAVNPAIQSAEEEKNRARTAAEMARKANKENTTTKEAENALWTDEEILLLTTVNF